MEDCRPKYLEGMKIMNSSMSFLTELNSGIVNIAVAGQGFSRWMVITLRLANLLFGQNVSENCMKMKTFWPREKVFLAPLGSATIL